MTTIVARIEADIEAWAEETWAIVKPEITGLGMTVLSQVETAAEAFVTSGGNFAAALAPILALALLCAACSSAPQVTVQPPVVVTPPAASATAPANPLSGFTSFTVADLQAASVDAHAANDPAKSWTCWDYLAANLPTLQLPAGQQTVGAFLAFQKARDLANGAVSSNGLLAGLNLACAATVIDTQTTVNKLLLLGAGTAATGGALAPAAAGLGALGPTLPIPLP